MPAVQRQVDIGNKILRALPQYEFSRLVEHLERVHLEKGEVVYIAGDTLRYAYFPINGLLSLISTTEIGASIELAGVGNEGMVGLAMIDKSRTISYDVNVPVATDAWRIKVEVLQEEFDRREGLHDLMLSYVNMLLTQISQSSVCHRFHSLEEALSNWLLVVRVRVNSNTLNLTQELISNALGVPRTGITMAAGSLQRAGLIRYSRGKIVILDPAKLEDKACECYRIIRDNINQFPNGSSASP
jgi:cAMP-binding proteins - catabolite gene activator and regulatory subunit of cAMP-dependent protein kinases